MTKGKWNVDKFLKFTNDFFLMNKRRGKWEKQNKGPLDIAFYFSFLYDFLYYILSSTLLVLFNSKQQQIPNLKKNTIHINISVAAEATVYFQESLHYHFLFHTSVQVSIYSKKYYTTFKNDQRLLLL